MPPVRERRDLASGEVMDEDRLIRFVAGPGGVVVPDLARKLPGRGLWAAANRAAVEKAAKGGFARAAKAKVQAPSDLAEQVERPARQAPAWTGSASPGGRALLTFGFDKTHAAIAGGRAAWLIEASDGAADGRAKLVALARRQPSPPALLGAFTSGELGLALGLENVVHLAFLAGRGAERWTLDVQRLSGFRPLLPESWREEP